ncbi:hypothetical protein PGT21_013040 [Puccinia graminis f. sp. tritici]|uniref:Uncharacterized protein n=1 Tax=Puccinia graminis f. sp. tritici TaxID=56615 RepID=A0A5B0QI16_PUCGR|nr:hypothetical protein PGT21_013040 [Puccinia graminis f. sp. tritici]
MTSTDCGSKWNGRDSTHTISRAAMRRVENGLRDPCFYVLSSPQRQSAKLEQSGPPARAFFQNLDSAQRRPKRKEAYLTLKTNLAMRYSPPWADPSQSRHSIRWEEETPGDLTEPDQ